MTLQIYTELKDTNWLNYILDEFCKIHSANFQIEINNLDEYNGLSNSLFYSQHPTNKITIPCLKDNLKSYKLIKNDDGYIYKDLITEDNLFHNNIDIFYNAFLFLSMKEEYDDEKSGNKINSNLYNLQSHSKERYRVPVVNILFEQFEKFIKIHYPELTFGDVRKAEIVLTHDLDYITKTIQLRIKQTAFNIFNALKNLNDFNYSINKIQNAINFLFSNPGYWTFDYWSGVDNSTKYDKIIFVYADNGERSFKKWLLDPSYNISKNIKLQNKLKQLAAEGYKIGLHGSFFSSEDNEMLEKEKNVLQKAINIEVEYTRQHWLRYSINKTSKIHEKLFKYDSTLGWNDSIGFRSGIGNKFRMYDHENNKPFNHTIIPQIIMDSNIYDYAGNKVEEAEKEAIDLINSFKKIKNGYAAISWHDRTCTKDYNWHYMYERLIKEMQD